MIIFAFGMNGGKVDRVTVFLHFDTYGEPHNNGIKSGGAGYNTLIQRRFGI